MWRFGFPKLIKLSTVIADEWATFKSMIIHLHMKIADNAFTSENALTLDNAFCI